MAARFASSRARAVAEAAVSSRRESMTYSPDASINSSSASEVAVLKTIAKAMRSAKNFFMISHLTKTTAQFVRMFVD